MVKKKSSKHHSEQEPQHDDVVYDDESSPADALKKARAALAACRTERQEYLAGWQRAKADAINREREIAATSARAQARAEEALLGELFSVLDSFDMAMSNREVWESVSQDWRVGIEHIHTQLKKILETRGIETIEAEGVPFNPQEHEPLETKATNREEEDDRVLKVLQKGYKTASSTLRPAKVIIGAYNV